MPLLYLITSFVTEKDFFSRLSQALTAGVQMIQLRLPNLDDAQYIAIATRAIEKCQRANVRLLLNCAPNVAIRLGADGIHLSAARLAAVSARPLARQYWVAASCHNRTELNKAHSLGLDFVVLSPVLPTQSHPKARSLGWETFADLARNADIPIYALGGMTPWHLPMAHTHGAQGIAAIGSVWEAPDIAAAIHACRLPP